MKNYHLWNPATDVEELSQMINLGPLCVARGEGAYVYNEQGEKYINAVGSLWNLAVGHGRKELCQAAVEQMEKLAYSPCQEQTHRPAIKLAEKLCEMTNHRYDMVFFGANGTDATESAIKAARQFFKQHQNETLREKYKIISFEGCYHGSSYGVLSAQSESEKTKYYGPLLPGFIRIEPPFSFRNAYDTTEQAECEKRCLQAVSALLEKENPNTIAAFIAEPIMGVAGIVPFSNDFFDALIKLLHENNILFIADEISTGFGRTGQMFASDSWQEQPDMMCLSKGLSSGYVPLSALLATEEVFENFKGSGKEFQHAYTTSGHPVSCAVALRNIQIIEEEKLCENARMVGEYLKQELDALKLKNPIIGDIRGHGLMIGIELVDAETEELLSDEEFFKIAVDCAMMGLMVLFRKNVLVLFPPLIIDQNIADEIIRVLSVALDYSKSGRRKRRIRLMKAMSENLINHNERNL